MKNPPDTSALPEMLAAYLRVLCKGKPSAVLDIGCGAGRLVCELRERGVYAIGVEVHPSEAARATGIVVSADAAHLPFASGSFDWVSFRHVPHHLPQPRLAFAEAWRVCRHGIVMAEPYYDPSIPSQQISARLDSWMKQAERRRGDFHADVLCADELIGYLPDAAACQVETLVPLRPYPI
ncbi:MAG: SAM-dependent methyltransferase, partial [Chlamydiales bacterium]